MDLQVNQPYQVQLRMIQLEVFYVDNGRIFQVDIFNRHDIIKEEKEANKRKRKYRLIITWIDGILFTSSAFKSGIAGFRESPN